MNHGECQRPGWTGDGWTVVGDMAWGEEPCWTSTSGHLARWASQWKCLNIFVRFAWSFWWMKRCGWQRLIWPGRLHIAGLRGRAMPNLKGWSDPVSFALTMRFGWSLWWMKRHGRYGLRGRAMPNLKGWSDPVSFALTMRFGWSLWWMKRHGRYGLRGRAMLNLNGWFAPVSLALTMLEHCQIWEPSLMGNFLTGCFGSKMFETFFCLASFAWVINVQLLTFASTFEGLGEGPCWTLTADLVQWASHWRPERKSQISSGGLRSKDVWIYLSDLYEAFDGWSAADDMAWGEELCWKLMIDLSRWFLDWRYLNNFVGFGLIHCRTRRWTCYS